MLNHYSWTETAEGYEFNTIQDLEFLVYFTDFFLQRPDLQEDIHVNSLGITCRQGDSFDVNRKDGLIQLTVTAIVLDYFEKNPAQSVLYLCMTDGKQRERRITFGRWFHEYQGGEFEKYDCDPELAKQGLQASIILRADHAQKNQLVDSFHYTISEWFGQNG